MEPSLRRTSHLAVPAAVPAQLDDQPFGRLAFSGTISSRALRPTASSRLQPYRACAPLFQLITLPSRSVTMTERRSGRAAPLEGRLPRSSARCSSGRHRVERRAPQVDRTGPPRRSADACRWRRRPRGRQPQGAQPGPRRGVLREAYRRMSARWDELVEVAAVVGEIASPSEAGARCASASSDPSRASLRPARRRSPGAAPRTRRRRAGPTASAERTRAPACSPPSRAARRRRRARTCRSPA